MPAKVISSAFNFSVPVALQLLHPNASHSRDQGFHHFLVEVASMAYAPLHELPAYHLLSLLVNVENFTSRIDWPTCSSMAE